MSSSEEVWTKGNFTNRTSFVGITPQRFPLDYRIVATTVHAIIFIIGVFGNIAVVVVVRKTRALHTPTYCYLVSLAVADLLVLCSAIPEAIVSYHLYARQWILGHAGCSLLIFGNFLGINASSTSILCFTIERYIGICKPLLAQKVCSVGRAQKIIIGTWVFAVIYCSPWLGLTKTTLVPVRGRPPIERCEFRLQRDPYFYFFVADLLLFYVLPLLVSVALYAKIGITLRRSQLPMSNASTPQSSSGNIKALHAGNGPPEMLRKHSCRGQLVDQDKQIVQVVRMLSVVVGLFAILWLPYRGLLVYNSLVEKPWLNLWYLLFAKSAIFVNSAINPIMYNAMSKRFRKAFVYHIFFCRNWRRKLGNTSLNPAEITWTRSSVPALTITTASTYAASPRGSMYPNIQRCASAVSLDSTSIAMAPKRIKHCNGEGLSLLSTRRSSSDRNLFASSAYSSMASSNAHIEMQVSERDSRPSSVQLLTPNVYTPSNLFNSV
ncbi:thyrotropin-releasing hormone receptor-like [Paramacrobiotus metropolitanus]|uniref:thyrotropin-releasing hormone receptor-like n=1 Tax=Paramacrobiotus metropolitanus TaxID=2943436 RepID=UPI002445BFA8|nr:thyrotropin-releasing hormone receptor-like [Paramacrobiotus metropolitanus]